MSDWSKSPVGVEDGKHVNNTSEQHFLSQDKIQIWVIGVFLVLFRLRMI